MVQNLNVHTINETYSGLKGRGPKMLNSQYSNRYVPPKNHNYELKSITNSACDMYRDT